MTKLKPPLLGFITITLTVLAANANAQSFDNSAVLALHNAGLGSTTISAKVKSLPCNYDLSTNGLIALKKAGLADEVIVAMVSRCAGSSQAQGVSSSSSDPATPHAPGIYFERVQAQTHNLMLLRPTFAAGVKVSGNGSIALPYKETLSVAQPTAQLKISDTQPTFWFYFDSADRRVGGFGSVETAAAQSPDEFNLVRFKTNSSGREFQIGKVKAFAGSSGIDPKHSVRVDIEEAGDGKFKVRPTSALEPGEYAFLLRGRENRYRIYDFTVVG